MIRLSLRGVLTALARAERSSGGIATGDEQPLLKALARVPTQPASRESLSVRGSTADFPLWLVRLDLRGPLMAKTREHERQRRQGEAEGWRYALRESGPQQIDLMVARDERALLSTLLPVRVVDPVATRDYLVPFREDSEGRAVARLLLQGVVDRVDVSLAPPRDVTRLNAGDLSNREAVRAALAATPSAWKEAWQRVAEMRPDKDPIRSEIEAALP